MKDVRIYITQSDFLRLGEIVKNMRSSRDVDRRSLDELEHSLNSRGGSGLAEEVRKIKSQKDEADWARIEELEAELGRAIVVDAGQIPQDVITMNSKVCLKDIDTGKDECYQLVYPGDADIEKNRISILAPVGTAILGYKEGDVIEWKVPAGLRRLKVKKVLYQPEAAKDYHL